MAWPASYVNNVAIVGAASFRQNSSTLLKVWLFADRR